jgi:hypothetical protein
MQTTQETKTPAKQGLSSNDLKLLLKLIGEANPEQKAEIRDYILPDKIRGMSEAREKIEELSHYEDTYPDMNEDREFEDDGNIHVVRSHYRFVFYNGQGILGALGEKDVKRIAKQVDAILKGVSA